MQTDNKNIKYPENLYLRLEVFQDDRTQEEIATEIGFSRKILNETINGKYKGTKVVAALIENLSAKKNKKESSSI